MAATRRPSTSYVLASLRALHVDLLLVAETAAAHLTGPEQGRWLARLDADQANLRRAAQHAADRPDGTALVLRLGVALDRYWRARSREQEARPRPPQIPCSRSHRAPAGHARP
jgi:hypothetical protein